VAVTVVNPLMPSSPCRLNVVVLPPAGIVTTVDAVPPLLGTLAGPTNNRVASSLVIVTARPPAGATAPFNNRTCRQLGHSKPAPTKNGSAVK
jgi:hypothetical protein